LTIDATWTIGFIVFETNHSWLWPNGSLKTISKHRPVYNINYFVGYINHFISIHNIYSTQSIALIS